jgi:hypothetical protein
MSIPDASDRHLGNGIPSTFRIDAMTRKRLCTNIRFPAEVVGGPLPARGRT